jgi:hypothetical protein
MTVNQAKIILKKHGKNLTNEQITAGLILLEQLISLIDISKLKSEKGKCCDKNIS